MWINPFVEHFYPNLSTKKTLLGLFYGLRGRDSSGLAPSSSTLFRTAWRRPLAWTNPLVSGVLIHFSPQKKSPFVRAFLWRRGRDSNPRYRCRHTWFRVTRIQPALPPLHITDRECCHSYPKKLSIMSLFATANTRFVLGTKVPRSAFGDRVRAFRPALPPLIHYGPRVLPLLS